MQQQLVINAGNSATFTVKHRFNEPLYDEVLGIIDNFNM